MINIASNELHGAFFDILLDLDRDSLLDLIVHLLGQVLALFDLFYLGVHDRSDAVLEDEFVLKEMSELGEVFVVQRDGPVFTKELRDVGDETVVESVIKAVEIRLREAY